MKEEDKQDFFVFLILKLTQKEWLTGQIPIHLLGKLD